MSYSRAEIKELIHYAHRSLDVKSSANSLLAIAETLVLILEKLNKIEEKMKG